MGEKDIAEKNLEAFNDVFADIVNVLLFKGNKLMKEKDLESAVKDSMFKADGKIHQQERDVSKFWKNGEVRISIFGFENQTKQDSKMPLRVISYDGASYKQQLLDNEKGKKDDTTKKSLYPVVTLVLYFGTDEKWSTHKNLLSCFKVPEELKPFVNDYKINVFNIAWLSNKTIDMFQSDFKIVAKYFQSIRIKKNYKGSTEEIKHVDALLKMLSALTGDNSFEEVYNVGNLDKGGVTMCEVVEKIKNEGVLAGKAELIRKMLDAKLVTEQQIADLLKISVKEVKKIAAKVPVQA
ncbi:MAG: Rpn family recombination-promoting nuclease/putative transposase [Treponema sp.]|nr:Rpn family recombination-promoting nuclease/putative transposase [Treponema sp.]MDY5758474.1 Rpn family recombination-promoting nuclease/putative transposase [Treponema sp.]